MCEVELLFFSINSALCHGWNKGKEVFLVYYQYEIAALTFLCSHLGIDNS